MLNFWWSVSLSCNKRLLNSVVEETTAQIKALEHQIEKANAKLQELVSGAEKVRQDYAELINWAKLFDNRNFEAKKMQTMSLSFAKLILPYRKKQRTKREARQQLFEVFNVEIRKSTIKRLSLLNSKFNLRRSPRKTLPVRP